MPDKVKNILVKAISWSQFQAMALQCVIHANHDEKRLLKQLIHYLGKVTNMQNQYSNLVYVVSLSRDTFSAADITFIDVVEKFGKYFHPVGGSKGAWPIEPPNYIAFRYSGALQSIHHEEALHQVREACDQGQPLSIGLIGLIGGLSRTGAPFMENASAYSAFRRFPVPSFPLF